MLVTPCYFVWYSVNGKLIYAKNLVLYVQVGAEFVVGIKTHGGSKTRGLKCHTHAACEDGSDDAIDPAADISCSV